MVSELDKEMAIENLLRIKGRMDERYKNLPVVANIYKKVMTIDDIINEIKVGSNFGNNFVISNNIRLKKYPQIKKYNPDEFDIKDEDEQGDNQQVKKNG